MTQKLSLLLIAAFTTAALAQTPLQFEVATVKASSPDAHGPMFMLQPGGALRVEGANLKQLITFAYGVRDFQVSGGPSWVASERFDVQAKPPQTDTPAISPGTFTDEQRAEFERQLKERVQSLLADRFQLKVRLETKEMPIYALVQAKGGSKLKAAEQNANGNRGLRMQRGTVTGSSAPIDFLVNGLANIVGRPVVNKTGLQGRYDWKLEWTPDEAQTRPGVPAESTNPPDASGPSIFAALQEQLGLKLESQKGQAAVVIVDKAEKPSAN